MDNTGQPYCPWLLIVRDILKHKKELSKDNMVQVVLYLDLNLLEIFLNNMYIKPYVLLLKIYQLFTLKRRYASNNISIESKKFRNLWNKTQVRTFHEKLIKTWKRQFGSNHIVSDTVFLRAFKTEKSYVKYLLYSYVKLIKFTLEVNMGQPILCLIKL